MGANYISSRLIFTSVLLFLFLFVSSFCRSGSDPVLDPTVTQPDTVQSSAEELPGEFIGLPGILNNDLGWPRRVESSEGLLVLNEPPQRVLTLSLGHDEMVLALLQSTDRLAGVGAVTPDGRYSNVADIVKGLTPVATDVEQVLAVEPDLVIISKFTDADFAALLKEAGVPVFRSSLENSAEGNIPNILVLGYMLGEEERALELAEAIRVRLDYVADTAPKDASLKVNSVTLTRYGEPIWTSGKDSTSGRIIESAGGINAAAELGIIDTMRISIESVVAMMPDIIFVPQSAEDGGEAFKQYLLNDPVMASVPAVVSGSIYIVDGRHFTNLSHWNVCGIEEAAVLMYPEEFQNFTTCAPFE